MACFNGRAINLSLLQMDGYSFLDFISQDRLVTLSLIIAVFNFPLEIGVAGSHVPEAILEPGGTITVTGLT